MTTLLLSPSSRRRAAVLGCTIALLLSGLCSAPRTASADPGPFSQFPGNWSGAGTIRQGNESTERIRCAAAYRLRGSSGNVVDLHLRCVSDTYNFDLTGQFQADAGNQVYGQWTEQSRNIGGNAVGRARGDTLQVHVESAGFSANVGMVTRGTRQSVTINSQGGGQIVNASITLRRN